MRVATRLFVAVIPAVLGVLTMAGLAYWGERGREIPEWLLVAGLLAAVASLGLAWRNTRYVARRIDALYQRRGVPSETAGGVDELDSIERSIAAAERRGETREQAAEALVREYAALLEDAAGEVGRRLDDVRLPLHILLSSPFGELNENQEEMIAAAHGAASAADEELRFVSRIVELDQGRVQAHPQPIRPRELLAPVLAAAAARIRQAGGTLETDLPPMLPQVRVDPRLSREALLLILDRLAGRASTGTTVQLAAEGDATAVRLRISDPSLRAGERFLLAERLLRLQGAAVAVGDGVVEVRLPI